jgi:hypothetical protein
VQDPLAEKLLAGDVKDGDKVRVAATGGALSFAVNGKAAKAA